MFLLFFDEYSNYFNFNAPPWAKVFVYLLCALEVGMDYYPFFICLATTHKLLGSVLGFFYALSWFCVQVLDLFQCQKNSDGSWLTFDKLMPMPSLFCCLFLMGRFIQIFATTVAAYRRAESIEEEEPFLPGHQFNHVKLLLRGKRDRDNVKKKNILQKIYSWDPNFKFPLRMIVTVVLCLICLFNFILADFYLSPKAMMKVDFWILETVNLSYINQTNLNLFILKESWFYSTFPAAVLSMFYVFHLLACYRSQIRALYAGKMKFIPLKRTPAVLAASIRYTGNQIAYLLWGYLLLHILNFLLGLAITFWFVLPIKEGRGMQVLEGLGYTLLGIGLMLTVIVAQVLAAQFFFLQDKVSPKDRTKPLAINNRRAFQNFSYFFMFYSVMLGFGICLVRLIANLILGSWLLAKIDRSLFPRGYERIDMGYCTWIGMLRVDLHQTHPVLVVFCHLLIQEREVKRHKTEFQASTPPGAPRLCRKQRCAAKWQLLYTLLNNPQLIMDRKQRERFFPEGREALERQILSTVHARNQKHQEPCTPGKGAED
ncbi:stimulated by retinoic acid gene 6 protein-like isoform X2 [Rhinatrema bivittatum]|nr:stimulated by retinoic acid gene 6 protein-like isoform X2 [Rhinatrema bivittatum]